MADGLKTCENNGLILELSIGGIFENIIEKPKQESVETQDVESPKRQIQGNRRRRKRDEMLKKCGSCGSVSGPFAENKEWLEKQIAKQNDDALEIIEPAPKKERLQGNMGGMNGTETGRVMDGFVNEEVVGDDQKSCGCGPMVFRAYDMNLKAADDYDVDAGISKLNSGGFASSVYSSNGQCSSHQDDHSGSNSSNSQLDQSDTYVQPITSSKQTVSNTKLTNSTESERKPVNPHESSVSNPLSKLEQTKIQHQHAAVLARMPCVSATGNGPNGKTISGFLYRYTKNEVSIMCVCHGQSFNPAGFVEHAGGVDIAHPLKHITIFPTAFAS